MTTPEISVMNEMANQNANRIEVKPQVNNIVATFNLHCRLNLREIALSARNAEYNPKRFDAVIMKMRSPKTTALIFSSGKVVVSGAKTEEFSRTASKKFAKIIKNMGYKVKFGGFRIVNVVATADCGFDVSIENLNNVHSMFSLYEPEAFSGLIYRLLSPKVTLMIFSSGKVNIVGAKTREEVHEAYNVMLPILKQFQRRIKTTKTDNKNVSYINLKQP